MKIHVYVLGDYPIFCFQLVIGTCKNAIVFVRKKKKKEHFTVIHYCMKEHLLEKLISVFRF
jgi:hypothetical protein